MKAPPLLVSFPSVDDFLKALPHELQAAHSDEVRKLQHAGLPPAVSLRCIAVLFGYSPRFVGAMYRRPERYYRQFSIRVGRKERIIQSPRVALKVVQKWIGEHIARAVPTNWNVYGFVPGRSSVDAATQHCGSKWIYSADIEDFFPSVTSVQVQEALRQIGYSDHASEIITNLCCYSGALPQGSPASPVLSNIVFSETDETLSEISRAGQIRYLIP